MASKFIEQVQIQVATPNECQYRYKSPIAELDVRERYTEALIDIKYCIGVHWERFVFAQPEDLPKLKEMIIEELRHDIYGEFVRELLRIRFHIQNRDHIKAKELIDKVIETISK